MWHDVITALIEQHRYYNNEQANSANWTQSGWFKTGDEGFLDEDGFLTLTGYSLLCS
jgi:long-subunit acyl-CoA synthetase (AMP-forming)